MPTIPPFPPQPDPEDEGNEQLYNNQEKVPEHPFTDEQVLQASSPEKILPPEAQGETNGGPLGCCLGVTVGIMLSLLLGVIGFGSFTASVIVFLIHTDAVTNTRIATAFFALIGAALGGYFGWKIGKRLYREYELTPKQKHKLENLERRQLERMVRRR